MEDIGRTVSDAWSFLSEPVLVTALLIALVCYLVPDKVREWVSRVHGANPLTAKDGAIYGLLETYGVSKILPLAALLATVFALHASNVTMRFLGAVIPGEVVCHPTELQFHVDRESLANFWAVHPELKSPQEAAEYARVLIATAQQEKPSVLATDSRLWQRVHATNAGRFNLAKAYLLVAVLLTATQVRRSGMRRKVLKRLAAITFCCLVAGTYYFFAQLYALEQRAMADSRVLQTVLLPISPEHLGAGKSRSQNDAAIRQASDAAHAQWWSVRFADPYLPVWIKRTISGRRLEGGMRKLEFGIE